MTASDKEVNVDAAFGRVLASAIDGRATFARFKQEQIAALFNLISTKSVEIVAAAQADTGRTAFELQLELTLVLRHIDALFKATDFSVLTKAAKANTARGVLEKPVGTVVIMGSRDAPFDSWMSPLASAIAAGNTALTLLAECDQLESLIMPLLLDLNHPAYQFLPTSSTTLSATLKLVTARENATKLHVFATSQDSSLRYQLSSSSTPCTLHPARLGSTPVLIAEDSPVPIATVAAQILRAHSTISYVLVNEEKSAELVDALVAESRKAFGIDASLSSDVRGWDKIEVERWAKSLREEVKSGAQIVLGGVGKKAAVPTVVTGVQRDSPLLRIAHRSIISILAISSLEDMISLVVKGLGSAAYVFGNDKNVKYLAEELDVNLVFANEIPLNALVGASPIPFTQAIRYSPSTFQKQTLVSCPSNSPLTGLFTPFTASSHLVLRRLRALAGDRKIVVRTPHSHILRRSFFPQGLFLVIGAVLSTVLMGTGYGVWTLFGLWASYRNRA